MKYAGNRNVAHVLLIGSQEREEGLYSLKDMHQGGQEKLNLEEIINKLK